MKEFLIAEYLFDNVTLDDHDALYDFDVPKSRWSDAFNSSSSLVLNASSPTSPGPASAYFDGTSFFETEGFFSEFASQSLTFEAWIKPGRVVRSQTLAALGDAGWGVMLVCEGGTDGFERSPANVPLT